MSEIILRIHLKYNILMALLLPKFVLIFKLPGALHVQKQELVLLHLPLYKNLLQQVLSGNTLITDRIREQHGLEPLLMIQGGLQVTQN